MEFYKTLQAIMDEKHLNIPEVARRSGLTDSTVRSILSRKNKSVALDVAFKLSKGLDISLECLNGDVNVLDANSQANKSAEVHERVKYLQKDYLAMEDRIKKIRKKFDLTQQGFADELGVKRNTIASYETGKSNLSDGAISLICKTFNISEQWLRTGEGPMEIKPSSFNLDDYVSKNGGTPEEIEIIKAYFSLPKDVRKLIFDHFRKAFSKPTYDTSQTTEESKTGYPPAENIETRSFTQGQDEQDSTPIQIGVDEALSYINGEHPINRFAAQKGLADNPENRKFTEHLADALHKDIHKTLKEHRNEKD